MQPSTADNKTASVILNYCTVVLPCLVLSYTVYIVIMLHNWQSYSRKLKPGKYSTDDLNLNNIGKDNNYSKFTTLSTILACTKMKKGVGYDRSLNKHSWT